jgi:hypothetical protein
MEVMYHDPREVSKRNHLRYMLSGLRHSLVSFMSYKNVE